MEDLLVEFWEDYFHEHPLEAHRDDDGHVVFETGDPLIDKWEQQIARGETPDLSEAFDPDELEKIRRKHRKGKRSSQPTTFGDTADHIRRQMMQRGSEWNKRRFPVSNDGDD